MSGGRGESIQAVKVLLSFSVGIIDINTCQYTRDVPF